MRVVGYKTKYARISGAPFSSKVYLKLVFKRVSFTVKTLRYLAIGPGKDVQEFYQAG